MSQAPLWGALRGSGSLKQEEFTQKSSSAAIHPPSFRDARTLETEGPSPNTDDTVTYSVLKKCRVVRGLGWGRRGCRGTWPQLGAPDGKDLETSAVARAGGGQGAAQTQVWWEPGRMAQSEMLTAPAWEQEDFCSGSWTLRRSQGGRRPGTQTGRPAAVRPTSHCVAFSGRL